MDTTDRRALIRWGGWFFLANGLLLGALGTRYLVYFEWPHTAIAQIYSVLAFVSHFALLALAPWLLVVLPLTLLVPARRLIVPIAVAAAAAGLAGLLVDSLVFAQDRFHLSALALSILGAKTYAFGVLYFAIFLGLCSLLASVIWKQFATRPRPRAAVAISSFLVVALLGAQALHIWADATFYVPITRFTPYLPLYRPWRAKHLLARQLGIIDLSQSRHAAAVEDLGDRSGILNYPLSPLVCKPPEEPKNVLLIGVDAMRSDSVNSRLAPNISEFARSSMRFQHHFSGGNATRTGLFSLFYGLPPTYWSAFYASQRSAVMIDEFQHAGYEFGVFTANPLDKLQGLDRTAFRRVSQRTGISGDAGVTAAWLEFMEQRDPSRSFFGFLFYESPPGACNPEYPRVSLVSPDGTYLRDRLICYETAVHFSDSQVGRVLDDLGRRDLLSKTIVIVTSDHGQEFDENGAGFSGHGSGYSHYQLQTPMIVHWPGEAPRSIERRTSHNDVAPTLLSRVLGCDTPFREYGSGKSLFSQDEWAWLVAGSYTGFAIVEPEQITISHGSYYEVRDLRYRVLESPTLDPDLISQAIHETGRFYGAR